MPIKAPASLAFGDANEGGPAVSFSLYKVPFQSLFGTGQDPGDWQRVLFCVATRGLSFIPRQLYNDMLSQTVPRLFCPLQSTLGDFLNLPLTRKAVLSGKDSFNLGISLDFITKALSFHFKVNKHTH